MSYGSEEKAERIRVQIQGLLVELNELGDYDEAYFKYGGSKYRVEDEMINDGSGWSSSRRW